MAKSLERAAEILVHYIERLSPDLSADSRAELADVVEAFRDADTRIAVANRRSREQMEGWKTGLEPEALDNMCVFGPREDDQPVP